MLLLLRIQVKCWELLLLLLLLLLLEHCQGFDQEKNQCVLYMKLKLMHLKRTTCLCITTVSLLLCYFRTTVRNMMQMNLFIIIHLN